MPRPATPCGVRRHGADALGDCDRYGADAISYAFSLAKGHTGCEADAVGQLVDLLRKVSMAQGWGNEGRSRGT